MKTQIQDGTKNFFRTAALGLLVLAGGLSPQASALEDGAAPKLLKLKIATPAGDAVEISTNDPSLSSVSLEVEIAADKQGVDFFQLEFQSPDKSRTVSYQGYKESPTKPDPLLLRDPLGPLDQTKQTYVLGAGNLSRFYDFRASDRPLDMIGTWTLTAVEIYGGNGKFSRFSKEANDLPTTESKSFQVTRWFTTQPAAKSVPLDGTLSLAPVVNTSVVPQPATYQWYRNGSKLAGATAAVYSKPKATVSDSGLYYLLVSGSSTSVRSDAVPVSVRSANVLAAREAINLQNATVAKQKAAAALAGNSTGGEELFVSALSELLGVLSDPRTAETLTSLGASVTLKFPFSNFTLSDTFPAAANSSSFNAWLSSVFLPSVEKADAALAQITDRNFVTIVSGSDFSAWSPAATEIGTLLVDYGDVQGLRVGLNGLSAVFRLMTSLDTSVRLNALQTLLPQGKVSVESLLKEYPNLLAAASSGAAYQAQAVDALGRAAVAYTRFSDFIYSSTPGAVVRYIDGDLNLINAQRKFAEDGTVLSVDDLFLRDYAKNIGLSIAGGKQDFIADSTFQDGVTTRYPVDLKALKERSAGLRSADASQNFVPKFGKNTASGLISNGSLNGFLPAVKGASFLARIVANEPVITKALGTREDQSAPVLTFTELPSNGSKVLLGPASRVVRFSGKVQDESDLAGVFVTLNLRGVPWFYSADLTEGQPKQVNGKTIRNWNWSLEVPFDRSGSCSYSISAEDRFNQGSVPETGSFGVVRAVRVTVPTEALTGGTLTVVPPLPSSGLVEVGTTLRISAVANKDSFFRELQVRVGSGISQKTTRPTRDLLVTDTTEISPVFVLNPFPALAGQWAGALPQPGADGFVNLTVTKTGTFTLRVVQGRNTFSYAGVMDASGSPGIVVPSSFYPVAEGGSAATFSIELNNGLRLKVGPKDAAGNSSDLAKAAPPEAVKGLPSKRFNAAMQNLASVGYFGFDVTPAGAVLATGMVNLQGGSLGGVAYPQKTVKYSFSTPLSVVSTAPNTTRLGVNFYVVASPSNISLNGSARIDGLTLSGVVGTSNVPAGPIAPSAAQDVYATRNVLLEGYGYKAPKDDEWALPASSIQRSLTAVVAFRADGQPYGSDNTMGKLNFTLGTSPRFVAQDVLNSFVKSKTTLGLARANGAFSGNLVTQTNGVQTARVYSGVVLRAAGSAGTGPLAVGLSADGLLISLVPVTP